MQLNLGNIAIDKNGTLSGNHVFGASNSTRSFGNTQVVAGGMVSGGATVVFSSHPATHQNAPALFTRSGASPFP